MACSAWLMPLLAAQLAAPPNNSRPLDPSVPRAVAHPSSKLPPPKAPPKPAAATPPPTSAVPAPTQRADKGDGCFAARARCRQLALPGVIATVVGVSAIGGGVGMIVAGKPAIDSEPAFLRDFQTPGIVAAAVGTAALVTGVVLIVSGKRAHRKAKGAAR